MVTCFLCYAGLWWRSSEKPFAPCGKAARLPSVRTPYFMLYGKSCQVSGTPELHDYLSEQWIVQTLALCQGIFKDVIVLVHVICFVYLGVISSRMPMSSCVTCWTTSTESSSTVATGQLTRFHLRMGSDSPPQRENVACELISNFNFFAYFYFFI